jgi:2-keto-3-deoxy-L-rhamnonate aldolase RhmA
MRENKVRNKMKQGKLAIGTYVGIRDPAIVEIIGLAGFDAAFIDTEHTTFNLETVEDMVRACDQMGITSLVRVPDNSPKNILRVLESGAQGIQVPHIASVADAIEAVKAVRYAPLGDRGMAGSTRAARYGSVSMQEHTATSNADILLSVMVEDEGALKQLAAIASVPGVDLIAIGPNDLSAAMGITQPNDPRLKKVIEEIADTLKKTGKARMTLPLMNAAYPVGAPELQRLGVAYCNCGPSEVSRLIQSFKAQVREINKQLGM